MSTVKRVSSPPLAMCCFSLCLPVSMTYFTPGMVIEVSAMLVARMHLRVLGGVGEKAEAFLWEAWAANMVHVRTLGADVGSWRAKLSIELCRFSISS